MQSKIKMVLCNSFLHEVCVCVCVCMNIMCRYVICKLGGTCVGKINTLWFEKRLGRNVSNMAQLKLIV